MVNGFYNGIMTVRVDKSGRLVVPMNLREELGIDAFTPLEIIRDGMELRIRKVEEDVSVRKEGQLLLVVSKWEGESDPVKLVRQARKDRISKFI
ncbi:MAG TPA: AbrB/MazE/SpoVT family DNA-binding domain-containing protein [Leptospiraceae bacterium]|nr:AbrB/MazE/SpoVT family DNA-binding domain-containing protein [Leptospiraceae bacterium]HNF23901.1 AbrB/MazE/SpoVT family DNA-binding domain-containing protein [Leptospiraceae bacterium]HNI97732.1 AbrB/MazE/SpoVT family DNA-binding domain-containing protein [Leptospiraceae bacterium]HNO23190.1 AbrB/MazE/SpoVT family DNA-binding domain-containing protein [Leptospiraceae bacterium]